MFLPTEAPPQGATPHLDLCERHDRGRSIVSCSGELVVHTSPAVRDAIADALATRPARLVVDLSDVSRLDPAGLVAVTGPAMAARRLAVDVEIVAPIAPAPRRLADLVGVLSLLGARR